LLAAIAARNRALNQKKHPHVVCRPEVDRDPFTEAAVKQRFVKDVNDV
jgi:hypothetical protein